MVVVLAAVPLLVAADESESSSSPASTPPVVKLPKADSEGWIRLFDGKSLAGWYGDSHVWRIADGEIIGQTDNIDHNTFLIYNSEFANFTLRTKCKLIEKGPFPNSGIQYRSQVVDPKKFIVHGYQADLGAGHTYWGNLYDEGGRGELKDASKEASESVKEGDWNDYEITADGTHLKQVVNGKAAVEYNDEDAAHHALKGYIALQYHSPGKGFEIHFKDVRIKVLPEQAR
jgi:hypothetical protein